MSSSPSRREAILQALARMLEAEPGGRITTAALAREVGVSEAALYRHFPSKTRMFEALIEFIETTLFSRYAKIRGEQLDSIAQCEQMLLVLVGFCERNPGITRLLTGDALTGENQRLGARVRQLYARIETELRQALRDAEMRGAARTALPVALTANLMLTLAEGRISQFVRSRFRLAPTAYWPEQWHIIRTALVPGDAGNGIES